MCYPLKIKTNIIIIIIIKHANYPVGKDSPITTISLTPVGSAQDMFFADFFSFSFYVEGIQQWSSSVFKTSFDRNAIEVSFTAHFEHFIQYSSL